MSCVSPILVKNGIGSVKAPCGRCLSCCIAKQSALTFLCQKELQAVYKRGLGASFVTLTYNDSAVPYVDNSPYMSLRKADLQKYLKRLRRYVERSNLPPIKFLACGELGDTLGRPHYHLVLFGLSDALAQDFTRKAWNKDEKGLSQIGALSSGGLRYVLKYMTKSRKDREAEKVYDTLGVEKPFITHSQKLGFDWIYNHAREIAESGYLIGTPSKKFLAPKYVRDVVERLTGVDPRPCVLNYLNGINTRGENLDDYLARMTYIKELDLKNKQIQSHNAYLMPIHYRKPRELR